MPYEMKDNDLSIFKNDKKTAGSNQPDMRGKAMIDGVVYKISAWTKGEGDKKFLSGKIEVDTYVKPEQNTSVQEEEQSDLPF